MYKKLLKVIITISILPIFLTIRMDPDMWWHLSLGKEILEKSSFVNNLTYTCSTYTWINHSWLSDAVMYWIQNNLGLLALSFGFFLLTLLGVYFNYKTFEYFLKQRSINLSFIKRIFFIIISFLILSGFLAIRPQIVTFVFVSILLNRLIKIYYENLSKKDILAFIILFILWPNLHGGFIIGYVLIGLFILGVLAKFAIYIFNHADGKFGYKYLKETKKFIIPLLITLPLSLLNPFGFGAWQEAFNNLLNSQNSDYINEWAAVNLKQQYGLLFFGIFLGALILMILNKRINLLRLSLFLIFGCLGLYTVRYILIAVPIVSIVFCFEFIYFYSNINKVFLAEDVSKKLKLAYKLIPYFLVCLISVGAIVNAVNWLSTLSNPAFSEQYQFETYPYKSVEFLKANPQYSKLNFLNDYGWGGYLSWALPEKKWFIDGRMAVWSCGGLEGSILKDFIEVEALGKDWQKVITSYNIGAVLFKSNSKLANVLREDTEWQNVFEENGEVIFIKR